VNRSVHQAPPAVSVQPPQLALDEILKSIKDSHDHTSSAIGQFRDETSTKLLSIESVVSTLNSGLVSLTDQLRELSVAHQKLLTAHSELAGRLLEVEKFLRKATNPPDSNVAISTNPISLFERQRISSTPRDPTKQTRRSTRSNSRTSRSPLSPSFKP
jgi:exonuclease VII small subunit